MTSDIQEAESTKYVGLIIVPLSSGRVALFSPARQLLSIYTSPEELWQAIRSFNCHDFAAKERATAPASRPPPDISLLLQGLKIGGASDS